MDAETIRRINLLECLLDEHPDVDPPPDDAALNWTERQLSDHFAGTDQAAVSAATEQPDPPVATTSTSSSPKATAPDGAAQDVRRAAADTSGDDALPSVSCQPGGGVEQRLDVMLDPANAPPALRTHQLVATVDGYRRTAIADGIPFRRLTSPSSRPSPQLHLVRSMSARSLYMLP